MILSLIHISLGTVCRKVAKALEGFEGFHFHQLRHTYTSNLLATGAAPKDVQELLGHSDVSTTMNVYAPVSYTPLQLTVLLSAYAKGDVLLPDEYEEELKAIEENEQQEDRCV